MLRTPRHPLKAAGEAAPVAGARHAARSNGPGGTLGVPGLTLIGVGGIIGAGFFLGSGLPIRTAGPAVLLAFLLGAVVNAQVIGALSSLAVDHPEPGAFMTYAKQYIGPYAGFLEGWTYYIASILTIASESVAMSIFSHLWIPFVPLWVLTVIYAAIVLAINALGVKNFGRAESLMSVMKIAALAGFIVFLAYLLLFPAHDAALAGRHLAAPWSGRLFPTGASGLFQSMLIVIFAYAGVGVFSTAASEMRHPRDVSKAAWMTVVVLTVLYLASIGLLLWVIPWRQMGLSTSPFVVALQRAGLPAFADVFNLVILIASFSVMAGAVFAANRILWGLGEARQGPQFVLAATRRGVPTGALAVTTGGVGATILVSYLLPANVYAFLISAASFLTFLNWFLILWAFLSWRRRRAGHSVHISSLAFGQPISSLAMMAFILFLSGYALVQPAQRLGFYAFGVLCVLVSIGYFAIPNVRQSAQPER
ncbi:MAG: amino acid permease [Clostridia bacterium]